MKTYCKRLVVSNLDFITQSISGYLMDKLENKNISYIFAFYNHIGTRKAAKMILEDSDFVIQTIDVIAKEMAENIQNRTVKKHIYSVCPSQLLVKEVEIVDGLSGKVRYLGLEKAILQLYEIVVRDAAEPLWNAKVGLFQVAAIKNRGQSFGKKHMERWLRQDPEGTKYCAQADVQQCYPSIPHMELQDMLHRDLGKSDELLYLFDTLFDIYRAAKRELGYKDTEKGIFIGSPASKDLCNYYMSKLYHYMTEKLFKVTNRRGKEKKSWLISHTMIFMDDIVIFSSNKKDLHKAVLMIKEFVAEHMKMVIKESWRKFRMSYIDKNGKRRGSDLDFMGFVFSGCQLSDRRYGKKIVKVKKVITKVRSSIFIRARRKFHRFVKRIKSRLIVSEKFAMSTISYNGWFTATDCFGFRSAKYWDQFMAIAKNIISRYAKGKAYPREKYYKKWRKLYA